MILMTMIRLENKGNDKQIDTYNDVCVAYIKHLEW